MVDSRTSQHPWTRARFSLHGEGPDFVGYHKGQKWNGFAVPFFDKCEADKVAARVVETGESYQAHCFYKKEDEFVLVPHGVPCYAGEKTRGEDIVVDGATVHVYGIGAGGWTWHKFPDLCESCGVPLDAELQCPDCRVSHTAAECATCGRHGYHKDDCTEPPGFDTEGGPKHVPAEAQKPEKLSEEERHELIKTFERAYQYYNGWGFSYEHPGVFTYYQLGGDLTVCFTPDWSDAGVVDVQVQSDKGDSFEQEGDDHSFIDDRSAPALFRIVKPYLDRLATKSAADLRKENA